MTKYIDWIRYFEQNQWPEFPFAESPLLNPAERDLITKSLRQFQLGEGAGGRTLRRLGAQFAQASGEAGYPRSLELFIAEEQRHSAMLGKFLDREGIARQRQDAADCLFRRVRKLWNHECMLMVLVSAECVAVPYYSALHDATTSPLLRALCRQILRDEAMHLNYQGQTLAKLANARTASWCWCRPCWSMASTARSAAPPAGRWRRFSARRFKLWVKWSDACPAAPS